MASNRKQPFGYRIVCGEIVPYESEAETVRWLFATYLAGASYSTLVGALQERGVPYDTGKPWNKNMVARILDDRRYLGAGELPAILAQEQFDKAQICRKERVIPCKKTPVQKELRRLCKSSPPSWVEGQVLGILNRLINYPELIHNTAEIKEETEAAMIRLKLDESLHSPPVEEAQIRSMAVNLAALRLNAIGAEEYESKRLQRLFKKSQPMIELEWEILHGSVKKIICANGTVTVLLKNQQLLEGGNAK